ncbi:MAG: N-acetylneuraminate synthase family protein [Clostridiales bacterium]|jgi:N-acetylneuraminate synthase|nr:N-acetylneuraminate synthase family protein [Clostridiales bacterium]
MKIYNGYELGMRQIYYVAEVNSSHSGSVEIAKKMIDAAYDAGCDCVKFQSWTADTLYSKDYYDKNPITKRVVAKFSLSEDELSECAEYCSKKGVSFCSTPYSKREVDFLVRHNVPFIKIASMDINNYPFLEYIAHTGKPIVLSTGMADLFEIDRAVECLESSGNKELCLLHCVSIYPTEPRDVNLNNILLLRSRYPNHSVGFSDHTLGTNIAPAAIAMGAVLIEKHLTLDRAKVGMDNQMALEPNEMKLLIEGCNEVTKALGSDQRDVSVNELEQRKKMRRSIVVTHDIKAGHVIQSCDLDAKRPGIGIPPSETNSLIGKTLARDVLADTLLSPDDILHTHG